MMASSQHPKVAVVILNWNGIEHLKTYLPSVLEHTPSEVVIWVADNGSTDDSVDWLTSTHSSAVQVLELGENFGFAAGYNRALAHIEAEVYVLLNSDVRIVQPWIDPTLSAMDAHGWDVASPLIAQDVNPNQCEHAGAAGGFMDRDGYAFCAGRMFDVVEPIDDWLARDREVFWASGACLFIRQSAWEKSGGFDDSLFAHMEEIDLCWRLKNLGHQIGCAGQVKVLHLGGGTLNTSSPFKTYLNFRNNLIVLLKNKRGIWPLFMFRRMALDGLAAWRMLFEGQANQFLAVGRAHGAFYLRLLSTLRKRRILKRKRIHHANSEVGLWPKSVTWARFGQGIKRVRDLTPPPTR